MEFSERISSLQPSAIREIFKVIGDPSIISFAGGNPDPRSFPVEQMSALAENIFKNDPVTAFQYSVTEGYPRLRRLIAERLSSKFGIGSENDDVLVLTGGQQAVDLTSKILVNDGDTVICEEPSFIGALNTFRSYRANLVGVPMEDDGINVEKLEQALKTEKNVKLLYLIPTFQNPMGVTMSDSKREKVYELAKKYGVIIFEDDPYGELRFSGKDVKRIKSLDKDGIVIYSSSFSKILSPGMRMGYVCAPKSILAKMTVGKQCADVHTNIFFQILVADYLEKCDIDAHIEKIRALYKEKNAAMLRALDERMPSFVKYTRPEGGLFIWCDLGDGFNTNDFSKKLISKGLAVVPGSAFLMDDKAASTAIRLNYSMPDFEQIDKGVTILAQTIGEEK